MNIGMSIIIDINNLKARLKTRARSKGIYENFGQKEVGKLRDKYIDCDTYDQRIWDLISEFNEWCMNFNDSDLRGS